MGAREVGLWVGEQKPLGKTPLWGSPSLEMTYLPTYLCSWCRWLVSCSGTAAAQQLHTHSVNTKAQEGRFLLA